MPKELEGQTQGFEDNTENDLLKKSKIHQTTAQMFWPNQQYCQKHEKSIWNRFYLSKCKQYTKNKNKTKNPHKNTKTQC